MNSIFVYCEITEEGGIADVSLELLSKGRKLADELRTDLEAILIGHQTGQLTEEIKDYGVNKLYVADSKKLSPYRTLPHATLLHNIFKEQKPEIVLLGASPVGRDLAPRVASGLQCGLTADCTSLEIGNHYDKKNDKEYHNLLYQIRPAFGGNIVATIINPETRPQMATVREGVMKREKVKNPPEMEVVTLNPDDYLSKEDDKVEIIERHIEEQKINIKNSQVLVSGGYGVGSKENFALLHELAEVLGGDVAASRAAVDAGFAEHERQVGQTGVTVRPKLYIACGISGAVQHRAGMEQSAKIISINTDPHAPINQIADYAINGEVETVIPKMIKHYKKNTK
ncbi:MAG: electron transfer flavoprotein subunit alpha/FixB family protein [Bacteroidales bacterium]|nr:electron transfer flavoprotein subunit alpha/FixB family protein [Bacteroidales bacterium]MCF8333542.1 electron transfer flavoprotein subunit alpha/FixB family protein [Bacteroidales bacterium]